MYSTFACFHLGGPLCYGYRVGISQAELACKDTGTNSLWAERGFPPRNPRSPESCPALPISPHPHRLCCHSRALPAGSLVRSAPQAPARQALDAQFLLPHCGLLVFTVTWPCCWPDTALRPSRIPLEPTHPPWPGSGPKSGVARGPNLGKELRHWGLRRG